MNDLSKWTLPFGGHVMKKISIIGLTLFSVHWAQADQTFAKKCNDLKENIKATAKGKAIVIAAQGAKAAVVGAALSGYQAAKCPAISVEEVSEILNDISN